MSHYHQCDDPACASWGHTAEAIAAQVHQAREDAWEAHRDGRDCGRRPCNICEPTAEENR